MPSFILTDSGNDIWLDNFSVSGASLGIASSHAWSVTKRTLHGGRREGVDFIEVHNGAMSFSIVPTRGMGIWKANSQGVPVSWKSPVADGPVNPSYVNLMNFGGLGWLEGFDELLARCGLENNGSPYEVKAQKPDGAESNTTYNLHGKIANTPAHFVAVHISDKAPYEITVEGHVIESKLFTMQVRMVTKITTTPGSNLIQVRDEFFNLRDTPSDMQILYHWNFGPPHLDEGARIVAPVKSVCPRDPRAMEDIGHYDVYKAPEPGYTEQVYFYDVHGAGPEGKTLAMLRNHAGDKGVAVRFKKSQLPAFTCWKNTGGLNEGYVTGLEPATNYPNPKPYEKARNRVVTIPPRKSFLVESALEILNNRDDVAKVEAEVQTLQKQGAPVVHKEPVEPFAPPIKA